MTGTAPTPAEEALRKLREVHATVTATATADEARVQAAVDAGRARACTWLRVADAMRKSQPWVVRRYGPRRPPGTAYPRRTLPTVDVADLPAAQTRALAAITAAATAKDTHDKQAALLLRDAISAALAAGNSVAVTAEAVGMDRANLHRWYRDKLTVERRVIVTVRPTVEDSSSSAA
jgi:hypothetical protein